MTLFKENVLINFSVYMEAKVETSLISNHTDELMRPCTINVGSDVLMPHRIYNNII
jgi:hypothetical protein